MTIHIPSFHLYSPRRYEVQESEECLIDVKEVCKRTGLSKSSVYRMKSQERFPQSVYNSDRGARWSLLEVMAWIKARDGKPPGKWQKPDWLL